MRHTSASLLIPENADPDVRGDLDRFFAHLVPDGDPLLRHRDEGPDDMPAHVRSALAAVQLSVPLASGRLVLAPGRASTSGSTGSGRSGARSRCICSANSWPATRGTGPRGHAR